MSDDKLEATITELVDTFRSSLLALLPSAERSKLNWRDNDQSHDWENLAECAFGAFVSGPIGADEAARAGALKLARYDIDYEDYTMSSWLALQSDSAPNQAFTRLLSVDNPFDTVEVAEIDLEDWSVRHRRTVPWRGAPFVLARRYGASEILISERIVAVE
ncbi:hypothetical protein ACFDTO_01295 [Microbacteriaceae bacterium 4G12]